MKGDFSRGFNPDRKRGRRYRRVLLQQGRLLLDSDVAALVDAEDANLRELARDVGCPGGSPDLGYLVTAGQLLAVFRDLDAVSVTAGTLTFHHDYRYKYLDRYPSLYLGAVSGVAGTARISLRSSAAGNVDFWVRADVATTVQVQGVALAAPAGNPLVRVTVNIGPATSTVDVVLAAGQEVWIGLIEATHNTTLQPEFSVAAGHFHLDGLVLTNPLDRYYPAVDFPDAAGFGIPNLGIVVPPAIVPRGLAAGDRLVAYLEGGERHLTAVEDLGILEQALGGRIDTTTRSQAMGQVKVAAALALAADEIQSGFVHRLPPTGTLTITTPAAVLNPDPCALPVAGGYTGLDNRLYRFEVHTGGPLASLLMKWSRDNGAELFTASAATAAQLTFTATTPLEQGELVEVLSERVDLGDQAIASFDPATHRFIAAERSAGVLARLNSVAAAPGSSDISFTLTDPFDDSIPVNLNLADFGDPANPALKVRRWHGLIRQQGGADPYGTDVEYGIHVSLTGTFSVGDYWSHEARVRQDNANGSPPITPHGPERLFAPLALLLFNGAGQPLTVVEWLDDRFVPLCELTADDISFDGSRIGTNSDTVQEVIEELWEREQGGCCDKVLEPAAGDTAARIRDILNQTRGDVVICLRRGIYQFTSQVSVEGRRVEIHGCPNAVIRLRAGGAAAFRVRGKGKLLLSDLTVFSLDGAGTAALVEVDPGATGFHGHGVGLIAANPASNQVCVRVAGVSPPAFNVNSPVQLLSPVAEAGFPAIVLEECVLAAGWAVSGANLGMLKMRGCAVYGTRGGVHALRIQEVILAESRVVAGMNLSFTSAWTPEDLLGDPDSLLAQLAAAIPANPADLANLAIGVRASVFMTGSVEKCRFTATYDLALGHVESMHFEGNTYEARATAIYILEALGVDFESESVGSAKQSPFTGIHIAFSAVRSSIVQCLVSAQDTAIRLLQDLPSTKGSGAARQLDYLQLCENQITSDRDGVLISATGSDMTVTAVNIEANEILAQRCSIRILQAESKPGAPPEIRIMDNYLESAVAVDVTRGACEAANNHVRFRNPEKGAGAFTLRSTAGAVLRGNLVEIGVANDSAIAISIQSGQDARLEGNKVVTLRQIVAVSSDRHTGLEAVNNDFTLNVCRLQTCTGSLVFCNNQAENVSVQSAENGQVNGNRVRQNLNIRGASGNWQVNDNCAAGNIIVEPVLLSNSQLYPYISAYDAAASTYSQSNLNNIVLLSTAGAAASDVRDSALQAAGNRNWQADWIGAVTNEVTGSYSTIVGNAYPAAVVTYPANEGPFEAQVVGNRCRNLQVGSLPVAADDFVGTVVVVTSNRATGSLQVQQYRDAVVVHNVSPSFSSWISSRSTRIAEPNLLR